MLISIESSEHMAYQMYYLGYVEVFRFATFNVFCFNNVIDSFQNYLVYTNTVLFIRSGGDNRFAGMMLAMATFGVLVVGPIIIGFIPIMVVGALIFYLGFDLLGEALFNTWGRVHRIEYLTVCNWYS